MHGIVSTLMSFGIMIITMALVMISYVARCEEPPLWLSIIFIASCAVSIVSGIISMM